MTGVCTRHEYASNLAVSEPSRQPYLGRVAMIGSIETERGPASFRSTNGLYFQIASLPETAGTATSWAIARRVILEADLFGGFSIAIRRIALANQDLHIAEQATTERLAVLASLAQEWRKRQSQAAMAL